MCRKRNETCDFLRSDCASHEINQNWKSKKTSTLVITHSINPIMVGDDDSKISRVEFSLLLKIFRCCTVIHLTDYLLACAIFKHTSECSRFHNTRNLHDVPFSLNEKRHIKTDDSENAMRLLEKFCVVPIPMPHERLSTITVFSVKLSRLLFNWFLAVKFINRINSPPDL